MLIEIALQLQIQRKSRVRNFPLLVILKMEDALQFNLIPMPQSQVKNGNNLHTARTYDSQMTSEWGEVEEPINNNRQLLRSNSIERNLIRKFPFQPTPMIMLISLHKIIDVKLKRVMRHRIRPIIYKKPNSQHEMAN